MSYGNERSSADFMEFTTDELVDELQRRSTTMVLAMDVESAGSEGESTGMDVKVSHSGDTFARVGLADLLSTHIRRTSRSLLDFQ